MTTMTSRSGTGGTLLTLTLVVSLTSVISIAASLKYWYRQKHLIKELLDLKNVDQATYDQDRTLHSIIHHFNSLQLDPEVTVEEANYKRTACYYLKSREAHEHEIVPGVGSYRKMIQLRHEEITRNWSYWREGLKSHRTVVSMCDATTSRLLKNAREMILAPFDYSTDINTKGIWIPELNIIPEEDMHVTVAIPWWWHTMREGNLELSKELASRFRQTLLLKFHHAFQIELQRIVLLGGKTLVALWRCVGERVTEEGHVVYDRHGENVDPFVRLRVEIVRCFTTESPDFRRRPLTYTDVIQQPVVQQPNDNGTTTAPSAMHPPTPTTTREGQRPPLKRQHSIEAKTPGMTGNDGFIHTTLARLPLECLSKHDVDLDDIHRLCREATATLSGHRMVVSKFRFLETGGAGGESNPCKSPLYDETMLAPSRLKTSKSGEVSETTNLHLRVEDPSSSRTVGAIVSNHVKHPSLSDLFDVNINVMSSSVCLEENDNNSKPVGGTPMLI